MSTKTNKRHAYAILGTHRGSTHAEVRQAYLELAKRNHPDAIGNYERVDNFAAISEAYTTLTSPALRTVMLGVMAMNMDLCGKCGGAGFTSKQKTLNMRLNIRCSHCEGSGLVAREDKP